ncbi:DNA-binding transcriptional MerR regulator [Georgenia soli]|uniref:DNA-binding transcriptional MerR regulator n=2 Tax=Georgenia soli TaxID=638953 RepID=A0A2A9EMH8_9MICO|nr:DNA-binding transcriptional MerR regulator [Georgenia soli]
MMQIGKFADRSGVSIHTLRHYDEVGLLRPSGRSEGGFRLYTEEDLERFLVIRRMKPLGFSLEEMRQVLEVVDALPGATDSQRDQLHARLDGFIEAARTRRAKVLEQVAMADELIGLLEDQRLA